MTHSDTQEQLTATIFAEFQQLLDCWLDQGLTDDEIAIRKKAVLKRLEDTLRWKPSFSRN